MRNGQRVETFFKCFFCVVHFEVFLGSNIFAKKYKMKHEEDVVAERQPKIKSEGTKRLFDNPVLESLTHTHFAVPVSIFYAFASFLLYQNFNKNILPLNTTVGVFLLGFLPPFQRFFDQTVGCHTF